MLPRAQRLLVDVLRRQRRLAHIAPYLAPQQEAHPPALGRAADVEDVAPAQPLRRAAERLERRGGQLLGVQAEDARARRGLRGVVSYR